jgi:pimeloyl-ACP methyl ester carboxylesterase
MNSAANLKPPPAGDFPKQKPFPFGDGLMARQEPGAGDGVLWIHGYTLSSASWQELWSCLSGWRHVGLDLPGHGASRPWRENDDLRSLAQTIIDVAGRMGLRHLVALSFGTLVAAQVAIQAPDLFSSITLGAPALGGGATDPEVERTYELLIRLRGENKVGPHLRKAWMEEPSPIFRGIERKSVLWKRLEQQIDGHSWEELETTAMYRMISCRQRPEALRKVSGELLILVGESDMFAFKRCAEIIRRNVKKARREYLKETGHLCMLQSPDLAARLIDQHLRRNAKGPPP